MEFVRMVSGNRLQPAPDLLAWRAITRSTVPGPGRAGSPVLVESSTSKSSSLEPEPSMLTPGPPDAAEYQTGIGWPGAPVTVTPSLTWRTTFVGDPRLPYVPRSP